MPSVAFLGRRGATAMADRARGLAPHFHSFAARFDFRDGPGLLGSLLAFVHTLTAARRHDALWLLSQHPARVTAAALGRLAFGTPFVVDTGDLLAESERTRGRGALWCALVAWWERRTMAWPDAVVVRGRGHVPIALAAKARRVVLVPDGVDVSTFARTDASAVRERIHAAGRITVGVVATISVDAATGLPSPGWDVVECLARLPELDLIGVIVGDGPGLEALQALAVRRGVTAKMRWLGRTPLAELPQWLSAIDIFLHTALNNPMSAVRTTGKLPLLLASGSAAVVSQVGEAAHVLAGTGLLLDFAESPDDYAARLAARVREIIATGELERWRESGPALARREFDYAVVGERAGVLLGALTAG